MGLWLRKATLGRGWDPDQGQNQDVAKETQLGWQKRGSRRDPGCSPAGKAGGWGIRTALVSHPMKWLSAKPLLWV